MNKTNPRRTPAGGDFFPGLLERGLAKLGLDQEAGADRFPLLLNQYMEEIELFNPAYGLVKVQDRRELVVKHILDSLAPLCVIRRLLDEMAHNGGGTVADVGSGAGFPGIPLAVCMPGAEFTLIERMGRRAGFLRDALAVLGLPNVRVEETEMEKFALANAGAGRRGTEIRRFPSDGFNLVAFRAFRPLEPAILRGLFRLLAPGGMLAAWKGRREQIEEEMAQALAAAEKGLSPPIGSWESVKLEVPFLDEERHLLIIQPG